MKRSILIISMLLYQFIAAQNTENYNFGNLNPLDEAIKVYTPDSTANALFLFENGETKFKTTRNNIIVSTTYYAKVKLFNKEGFKNATIEIPIYHNRTNSEKVKNIRAITHHSGKKISLTQESIFTDKLSDYWSMVKFTMPDLTEQCIIEYEYTLESPFEFNFKGWSFQENIPKLYSRFYALIPGNYVYNRRLVGSQKLNFNDAKIMSRCFKIEGIAKVADCEELTYIMEDIPAFVEEDYLTSRKNFASALKFELEQFTGFDGVKQRFTKSWKNVDDEIRSDENIGRQLRKADYIEKNMPPELFSETDELKKAKNIYHYIKSHFTFNNKIRLFADVNVKDAYDQKIGNSTEINIALINALTAANINTDLVLLSTRDNGLPTHLHPVISDFNYAIARVLINKNEYFLDATDKLMPFGMLPFVCLNGQGRVMDFNNDSYWTDINPVENNYISVSLNIKINEQGTIEGTLERSFNGYEALEKRREILSMSKESYQNTIEDQASNLRIEQYENSSIEDLDEAFKEKFDVIFETDSQGSIILFNPFLVKNIDHNPFKLNQRTYPVDFGYPSAFGLAVKLEIPENFIVKNLPEEVAVKLPNEGGNFIFNIRAIDNTIQMSSRYRISKSLYSPEEYHYIKEFFKQIINTQKSLITLEKI